MDLRNVIEGNNSGHFGTSATGSNWGGSSGEFQAPRFAAILLPDFLAGLRGGGT